MVLIAHGLAVVGMAWVVVEGVRRVGILRRLGDVITAYALGITLRNGIPVVWDDGALDTLASVAVPPALVLMLGQSSLRMLWNGGRQLAVAWVLQVVSVVVCAFAVMGLWGFDREALENGPLAVAVYTGGIINLALLSQTLGLPPERFGVLNVADIAAGALYLLLIMNLGRFVFRHNSGDECSENLGPNSESGMHTGKWFSKLWPVPLAMGIVGAAFGLLAILGLQEDKRWLLIAITVGGLALSGWPVLRHNGYAGRQADFLVTCFALCMGLMANLRSFTMEVLPTAAFLLSILLGSVGIHFLLCRLLGLPDGLFVATSAGGIMSPPFVPGICRATRHRSWIAFGVAAGLAGNATGTLLGLAVYEAAKGLAF